MFIVTERRGSPRELGLAHGREYRHGINRLMQEYMQAHSHQNGAQLLDRLRNASLAFHREKMGRVFDELHEEMRGISEGSGAPPELTVAFNLMGWPVLWAHSNPDHFLRNFPYAPGVRIQAAAPADHCSSVAARDSDHGPLVAGNLDDLTLAYRLEITRPQKGYAFADLGRLGMAGCARCMNEAGLAIGVSSVWPVCDDWLRIESPGALNFDLVVRAIVQNCATVKEALDLIKDWPTQLNLMLADASGDVARVEMSIVGQWVTRPNGDWIVAANHYASPESRKALAALGIGWDRSNQPNGAMRTHERYARYEELLSAAPRKLTLSRMQQTIADHDGWPFSICSTGSVSTVAICREKRFLVADKAPCANPFQEVRL